jgi:hypothetical protein
MGLRRRLERLEGGSGCDECRIVWGEPFHVRFYGLPPKPRSNPDTTSYAPPGEKPRETCPTCGKKLPVIRFKGLTDKPGGGAGAGSCL